MFPLIDSHVHLFARPHLQNLAWLTSDSTLYGDRRLEEYLKNKSDSVDLKGLVFIETDVHNNLNDPETGYDLAVEEYLWIERIINGQLLEGEGSTSEGDLIKAIIPWAPVPNGSAELKRYFDLLKERSHGDKAFNRVKGVRYLVQDKPSKTMLQPAFVEGLNWLGANKYVFDLGIDTRSRGNWQLEEFLELIEQTTNVTYIINHLTKPDLYISPQDLEHNSIFDEWKSLLKKVSSNKNNTFYIKLSGGFSELPPELSNDIDACINHVFPRLEFLLEEFGEDNIIWGSDWPVCTINGGEDAFQKWVSITTVLIERLGINSDKVFLQNVKKAYSLDV